MSPRARVLSNHASVGGGQLESYQFTLPRVETVGALVNDMALDGALPAQSQDSSVLVTVWFDVIVIERYYNGTQTCAKSHLPVGCAYSANLFTLPKGQHREWWRRVHAVCHPKTDSVQPRVQR